MTQQTTDVQLKRSKITTTLNYIDVDVNGKKGFSGRICVSVFKFDKSVSKALAKKSIRFIFWFDK